MAVEGNSFNAYFAYTFYLPGKNYTENFILHC